MRTAHIYLNLFLSGIAAVVLSTNCVVNGGESSGDGSTCTAGQTASCTCGAGKTGERTCNSSGTGYGACSCAGSTGGSGQGGDAAGGADTGTGGEATANGGAAGDGTTAGGASSYGGAESAGGAGGAGVDPLDACDTCMATDCMTEFDACLADPTCFSDQADGSGQYEGTIACVEELRATQAVKRQDLADCGIVAVSSNSVDWPPPEMAATTTAVLNCMAIGDGGDSTWADTGNVDTPWPATSCAKLSCTSQL